MNYFHMLLDYEYELVASPAGAKQWQPINQEARGSGAGQRTRRASSVPTMMTTADMAFRWTRNFGTSAERFRDDPAYFADAFARAWFKLTHRDMGPKARYLGPEVPVGGSDLAGSDSGTAPIERRDRRTKTKILDSGLTFSELVKAAWASASPIGNRTIAGVPTARASGLRRRRLGSQRSGRASAWASKLDVARGAISLADAIVLAGSAAVEKAARDAGLTSASVRRGRADATEEQTDAESFEALEPRADGFRNYLGVPFNVPT